MQAYLVKKNSRPGKDGVKHVTWSVVKKLEAGYVALNERSKASVCIFSVRLGKTSRSCRARTLGFSRSYAP